MELMISLTGTAQLVELLVHTCVSQSMVHKLEWKIIITGFY